jgi:hypothetical protein
LEVADSHKHSCSLHYVNNYGCKKVLLQNGRPNFIEPNLLQFRLLSNRVECLSLLSK